MDKLDEVRYRINSIVESEEVALSGQAKQDLTDLDSKGKVEHVVFEIRDVELVVLLEDPVQEVD